MNKPISKFIILALAASAGLTACNSTEEEEQTYAGSITSTSTLVTAFSIKANTKVMKNLNKVFFSIDQVKGEIYNADSLPWGTDVRKLVANITTAGESQVSIVMPSLKDGSMVTVTPSDSINFTGKDGVWLRITSPDGSRERTYGVKVNVHTVNPDSLQWDLNGGRLPIAGLRSQQTVEFKNTYICLGKNGSGQILAATSTDAENWTPLSVNAPADADVNTLTATASALYMLTGDGRLLTSADTENWSEATNGWSHIYGAYGDRVIGVKDGKWIDYPAGNGGEIPAGMPISGTSRMWTYTNDWALSPQSIFVGGSDAEGNLSCDAWGFDGTAWMRLSGYLGARQLPAAEGMTLLPYFTFRVNTSNFLATKQSMWLAFGGRLADGTMNAKVYMSLDNGVNWLEGSESIQLPKEIAPRVNASVLLIEETLTSRAIRPITSWDAPFIRIVGGYGANGSLFDETWTGVINRLTFKPLQ